jgi:hypothetical protein
MEFLFLFPVLFLFVRFCLLFVQNSYYFPQHLFEFISVSAGNLLDMARLLCYIEKLPTTFPQGGSL